MIGFLATKLGMSQIFNDQGLTIPITILQMGECYITQVKTSNTDGYNAVQIGYHKNLTNTNKITKPIKGHLKKANLTDKNIIKFKEFKLKSNTVSTIEIGQKVQLNSLKINDRVTIIGYSIGKGFTGYQKRHKFSRGPMSHGSKNHRLPGSIGAGTTPGRVFPGKKMAGHLGEQKTTIKNLEIVFIDFEKNIIAIKGSVPGKIGNLISIYK